MVKNFTINLNKGEGEAVLRNRKQERRSYLLLALFAVVFLVLGGLTWAQNESMNDVITSRKAKLDRIRFELDSLKREATKVSKDDVSALAKLENERFLWSRRLEKLAQVLPTGMALTGLQFQNRIFTVDAIAQIDTSQKEFEVISKFIELLKSTPEFRQGMYEIRFDKSLRKSVEGQEILIFSVQCLTNDPDKKAGKAKAASSGNNTASKITSAATKQ
jgi:Tfp pilus assembly protein PilN